MNREGLTHSQPSLLERFQRLSEKYPSIDGLAKTAIGAFGIEVATALPLLAGFALFSIGAIEVYDGVRQTGRSTAKILPGH